MMKKTAISMFVLALMLLSLLLQTSAHNTEAPTPQPQSSHNNSTHGTTEGSLRPEECGPHCDMRCSNTQYKKPCLFFCKKCCATCLCVPSGTYGNKQSCPCYNNWKTKRGGPKCP